jgi:predicted DNA-binding transcriptional regulator YafY
MAGERSFRLNDLLSASFVAARPLSKAGQSVGELIVEAGRANQVLRVTYISLAGNVELRYIEPLEIKAHGKKIQLYAHHRGHHRTASFVLDRIIEAEIKPRLRWESHYTWRSG